MRDTHVAIVMDERTAAAGEGVLLHDGHLEARFRESGSRSHASHSGTYSITLVSQQSRRASPVHLAVQQMYAHHKSTRFPHSRPTNTTFMTRRHTKGKHQLTNDNRTLLAILAILASHDE